MNKAKAHQMQQQRFQNAFQTFLYCCRGDLNVPTFRRDVEARRAEKKIRKFFPPIKGLTSIRPTLQSTRHQHKLGYWQTERIFMTLQSGGRCDDSVD